MYYFKHTKGYSADPPSPIYTQTCLSLFRGGSTTLQRNFAPKTSQTSMIQPDCSRNVGKEEKSVVFVYGFLWECWRGKKIGTETQTWQMEILKKKKCYEGDMRVRKTSDSEKSEEIYGKWSHLENQGCGRERMKHTKKKDVAENTMQKS